MSADVEEKVLPDLVLDIDTSEDENPVNGNAGSPTCSIKLSKNCQETLTSTPQLLTTSISNTNGKPSTSEESKCTKLESRATPRRAQFGACKQKTIDGQSASKQCEQHTFLTDITEVRQMEQGLLKLLEDFHSGKLQAFGKDCTFEKMEKIREQQERLARLHFDLNAQQEIYGQSEDGRRVGRENLSKLIENLQQLSRSIEQLQISSPSVQTDV